VCWEDLNLLCLRMGGIGSLGDLLVVCLSSSNDSLPISSNP